MQKKIISNKKHLYRKTTFLLGRSLLWAMLNFMGINRRYQWKQSIQCSTHCLNNLLEKNKNLLWQVIIWLNPPPSKSGKWRLVLAPLHNIEYILIHCYRAGGVDPKSKSKKHVAGCGWLFRDDQVTCQVWPQLGPSKRWRCWISLPHKWYVHIYICIQKL